MRDEAQVARYAEIVARLARPLADRDAVLWLVRLDDAGFARLERTCLTLLAEDPEAAVAFARAFARTMALLDDTDDVAAPTVVAPTQADPETRVPDLAVDTDTLPLSPTARVDSPDAMYTLASATQALSPRKRGKTGER